MEEIKWGMIGCGDVTEVKSGPAFNKVPNSKLVAVMRRDAEKAADYAKRHQVEKWYDDATALINDPEVNAIYIATPPSSHEAYTLQALALGKPVYVEKPMAINAKEANHMVNAARQSGIKLTIAHYRRAQPFFLKIKTLLDENAIGEVRLVELKMLQPKNTAIIANSATNWRVDPKISGGGLFHDLAPHQLDLMLYFFGNAKRFSGIATHEAGSNQVDDLVTGQILFENNVVFNGTWNFSAAPADELDQCVIYGSKGKISFPVFGNQITLKADDKIEHFDFLPLQHVQQPMIAQVVDYFLGIGPNPCSAEEALKTMELIDAFTVE